MKETQSRDVHCRRSLDKGFIGLKGFFKRMPRVFGGPSSAG